MDKISGFATVEKVSGTFGILNAPGLPGKIFFAARSTLKDQKVQNLCAVFNVGEEVGYSGGKLEKSKQGCMFEADFVRKKKELVSEIGVIESMTEKYGILKPLGQNQNIFFPGRSFKGDAKRGKDLSKVLSKGQRVEYQAIPNLNKNDKKTVETLAIHVSLAQTPPLATASYRNTVRGNNDKNSPGSTFEFLVVSIGEGFGILWSKYHGKVFCPRFLLDKIATEQRDISVGSWVIGNLEAQEPKSGTYWRATKVDQSEILIPDLTIQQDLLSGSVQIMGPGLILAVKSDEGYLWNQQVGRLCFKTPSLLQSAKHLQFTTFVAKFNVASQFDQNWEVVLLSPSSGEIPRMSSVKFGSGMVTEVKPENRFGFIRVSNVIGSVYFRASDYDGQSFHQLKGQKCLCAYAENFDPKKGKGYRALFVVEHSN